MPYRKPFVGLAEKQEPSSHVLRRPSELLMLIQQEHFAGCCSRSSHCKPLAQQCRDQINNSGPMSPTRYCKCIDDERYLRATPYPSERSAPQHNMLACRRGRHRFFDHWQARRPRLCFGKSCRRVCRGLSALRSQCTCCHFLEAP